MVWAVTLLAVVYSLRGHGALALAWGYAAAYAAKAIVCTVLAARLRLASIGV
jgi:hypothetical protein